MCCSTLRGAPNRALSRPTWDSMGLDGTRQAGVERLCLTYIGGEKASSRKQYPPRGPLRRRAAAATSQRRPRTPRGPLEDPAGGLPAHGVTVARHGTSIGLIARVGREHPRVRIPAYRGERGEELAVLVARTRNKRRSRAQAETILPRAARACEIGTRIGTRKGAWR